MSPPKRYFKNFDLSSSTVVPFKQAVLREPVKHTLDFMKLRYDKGEDNNIILSACSVKPVEGQKFVEFFEHIVPLGFKPMSSTYSEAIATRAEEAAAFSMERSDYQLNIAAINKAIDALRISQNDIVNLLRCVAYQGDLDEFVAILDECSAAGIKLDVVTRNQALAVFRSSGAMDFAGEFVSRTADVPLDAITYNTLMKGYALTHNPQLCIRLYEQMRSDNVAPSDVTVGILLDACVGGSMLEEAQRVFDDLKASQLVVSVIHYTTFLKGLVSAGSLSDAPDVVTEMHRSPPTKLHVITYSTLANPYANAGNVDDGIHLLKMMRSHGIEPDVILYSTSRARGRGRCTL